jgi:hypothetical protein
VDNTAKEEVDDDEDEDDDTDRSPIFHTAIRPRRSPVAIWVSSAEKLTAERLLSSLESFESVDDDASMNWGTASNDNSGTKIAVSVAVDDEELESLSL